jgi:DNA-binding MarR family transcriptional regulator
MKRRPNPPLIAARSFEAAARHLSFQEAAAELHVTPTAISHQVKRLEEYLGLPLFVRQNRAVVLTPYGETLAARLFELFTGLEDVLQPPAIGDTQALRVTAMPSLAMGWTPPPETASMCQSGSVKTPRHRGGRHHEDYDNRHRPGKGCLSSARRGRARLCEDKAADQA